jgi:butyryl-CoA dehydrogenase
MELTPTQQAFHERVRDFACREVQPRAAAIDSEEAFPADLVARMAELELLGIPYPRAEGGAGLDTVCYALAVEEISRACGSTGITLAAHTSLGTNPIHMFGSAEQKERWLPPLCSGRTLGAFGLTEPGAGSDAGGTRTWAQRQGGGWVVNGAKMWITNAGHADVLVITALTDREKRQISCFLIEKGATGYHIGPCEKKLGLRGSDTHALTFENLFLPEDALLGEQGKGFRQMLKTLDGGRISIGAMALGLAQAALDEILEVFKGVSLRQSHAFFVADMATRIRAARHLVLDAARAKDAGQDIEVPGAMAKLFASETASWCADRAIQILGAEGYTRAHAAERVWRDAKLTEIGEGTSEIQRLVISRRLLEAR